MKGLATAIAIRRREIEQLRLALGGRQRELARLAAASAEERVLRQRERHLASATPLFTDAWFDGSSARLTNLAAGERDAANALASLRLAARDARARLSVLEEAEALAQRAALRRREARVQEALDDRTAVTWGRR